MKITVKYAETSKKDDTYILDKVTWTSYGISLENFDVTKLGSRDMILYYKATPFIMPYEVVDYDWVESATILQQDTIKTNYLVGETFDVGSASLALVYNSNNTGKENITSDMIYGFSTAEATSNGQMIIHCGTNYNLFLNYKVYSAEDLSGITELRLREAAINISVGSAPTYEEYLKNNKLELIMSDGQKVSITAATDGIALSNATTGATIDEAAYGQIITKGQSFDVKFTYKASSDLTCTATIHVDKLWNKTVFENWNTVVTNYTVGEGVTFDFGTATMTKYYNDGTVDETISLQAEYEKAVADRTIDINNLSAVDVASFDMTAGAHNNQYYIVVSKIDEFIVDGVNVGGSGGRFYISYTVE